jgi:transcriptional regulator with XRE-family HTH domain
MQIGSNIKTIRTSKKISQKALAYKLGVTPVYLSMIENNAKTPSLTLMEKIAKTLEIPLAILFSDFAFS